MTVESCELPASALLAQYCEAGAHTDCFRTPVAASVSLAEYVEAFYTTPVFRLERFGPSLCFGPAVVPARNRRSGKPEMGLLFRGLLEFQKRYSRILLGAAATRLA